MFEFIELTTKSLLELNLTQVLIGILTIIISILILKFLLFKDKIVKFVVEAPIGKKKKINQMLG